MPRRTTTRATAETPPPSPESDAVEELAEEAMAAPEPAPVVETQAGALDADETVIATNAAGDIGVTDKGRKVQFHEDGTYERLMGPPFPWEEATE